MLTNILAFYL